MEARKIIKIYQKDNMESPFVTWLESLDAVVRHRVKSRLARVSLGNLGEYKLLSADLFELKLKFKFRFGSAYRVYFSEVDAHTLLLLCGGDKKTQTKDIKLARRFLKNYLHGENHG